MGLPGDRIGAAFDEIGRTWGYTRDELRSYGKSRHLCDARNALMVVLIDDLQLSKSRVGQLLGGRDHTTILHGYRRAGVSCDLIEQGWL